MSIIGEALAASTAKQLEEIILRAMHDPHWSGVRSEIQGFAREELVEWYYDQCIDSYGMHNPNQEIIKAFPPREK